MTIDVARAREETPGCQSVLHFNNAGASLMPTPVLDAVMGHLQLEAEIGGYEAEARARDRVECTYDVIAALLGCAREEIALLENATRAWDMAFYSIPFEPGDRILTSMAEYSSNYIAFLQMARRTGVQVEAIPNDASGQVSVGALRSLLDERVKLIAITHAPTNGGLINPAVEIGRAARESGTIYLLDACQSVGQMSLHVDEIGCDILSATGRKFLRGPRGTGFLYVRRSMLERLEPPFLDNYAAEWVSRDRYVMRTDTRRFETWEGNIAGKIGLGIAVDYALGWGLEAIRARVTGLATLLRAELSAIPGVVLHDLGVRQSGIVTFTMDPRTPQEIQRSLSEQGINVSVTPLIATRLDMEARGLQSMVRASVHYYNTEEEIDRFCTALKEDRFFSSV